MANIVWLIKCEWVTKCIRVADSCGYMASGLEFYSFNNLHITISISNKTALISYLF